MIWHACERSHSNRMPLSSATCTTSLGCFFTITQGLHASGGKDIDKDAIVMKHRVDRWTELLGVLVCV